MRASGGIPSIEKTVPKIAVFEAFGDETVPAPRGHGGVHPGFDQRLCARQEFGRNDRAQDDEAVLSIVRPVGFAQAIHPSFIAHSLRYRPRGHPLLGGRPDRNGRREGKLTLRPATDVDEEFGTAALDFGAVRPRMQLAVDAPLLGAGIGVG